MTALLLGALMPKRLLRIAYRSVTAPAVRYPPDPRAVFLLIMCVLSGVPLVFAHATPQSIVAQLQEAPHGGKAWVVIWGIMLTGGAALTLAGAVRQSVNGVIAEQVGSVALGFACVIFALAIYGYLGWSGGVFILLILGFGLSSWWRYGQLVAYLNAVESIAQMVKDEEAPSDE